MNILIDNISQLITMNPMPGSRGGSESLLGIIDNGRVFIENEIISWTGAQPGLPEELRSGSPDIYIDAGNCVVMPGLIDAHTHLIFSGSREQEFTARLKGASYEEILAAGGGIHSTVAATRSAAPKELFMLGMQRLDFCLDHGVTTVEIKSGYGLETSAELKMLETAQQLDSEHPVDVVSTFLGAHVVPKEFHSNRNGYIEMITREMLPEIAAKKLAAYCDVFIDEGAYSADEARIILEAACDSGLRPRLHVDQFNDIGGIELAVEFNAVSVDHLEAITPGGIESLARSAIPAVLLPGAAFFLGMKQYAPARDLITAGVPVVLATDFNPGSCMTAMPYIIMTLACVNMQMRPAETIAAFTMNAARALDKPDRGALKKGLRADIIILDVENYQTIPYHFARNHTVHVIKNGEIVR